MINTAENPQLTIPCIRQRALTWWNGMNLEDTQWKKKYYRK